ncbi:MAG TPA: hypothetical protein VFS26_10105 [Solirubrobacterales bacterium]|nr:hypothetical protein [Solirubrobacterales bacterium]
MESSCRRGVLAGCLLTLALLLPAAIAAASPDLGAEEGQGQRIAESVRAGERTCSQLSGDEFELVGEYAMGSYLGDTGAHEAMNDRMVAMMGEAGERRMHIALGHRFLGCGGGPTAGWMGPMAGMMFGRGGGYGPGMMGGAFGAHHDGLDWPSMAAIVAIGAALLGAIVVGFLWLDRRRAA